MKDHLTQDIKKTDEEEFDIKILRDGTWLHQGRPIKRAALVKLFSTVLLKDEAGQHWLKTPVERGRVEVEDSAFVTTQIDQKDKVVFITTNIDKTYKIGAEYPLVLRAEIPYVVLEKNLEARIARTHFYELAKWAVADPQDSQWMGIESDGQFFRIGKAVE